MRKGNGEGNAGDWVQQRAILNSMVDRGGERSIHDGKEIGRDQNVAVGPGSIGIFRLTMPGVPNCCN